MADPVEKTAPLERVVKLARAVRRQDDRRPSPRAHRADLRNGDLEIRKDFEQKRLELVVGAVDLVDQQDHLLRALDRLEQRPPDQEIRSEELLLRHRTFLRRADVQQLTRVIPLVDRVRNVESLVALESNEPRRHRSGERLRRLGLTDAGFALEQEGLLEYEREKQRRRQTAFG